MRRRSPPRRRKEVTESSKEIHPLQAASGRAAGSWRFGSAIGIDDWAQSSPRAADASSRGSWVRSCTLEIPPDQTGMMAEPIGTRGRKAVCGGENWL